MEAHKAEARKIGARLVAAARALDELFHGGAVARTAVLEGEYRLARYDALRGYAAR